MLPLERAPLSFKKKKSTKNDDILPLERAPLTYFFKKSTKNDDILPLERAPLIYIFKKSTNNDDMFNTSYNTHMGKKPERIAPWRDILLVLDFL